MQHDLSQKFATEPAKLLLKAMGNSIIRAGGFLIGIEALLIGQRFGLDPALMVDVLDVSTGMNNSTQKKFKHYW